MPPIPEFSESLENGGKTSIITKEFLEKALKFEDTSKECSSIISYKVVPGTKPGDNYMSLIYSVDLTLSTGERRHLLVKCYPNHPSRQKSLSKTNVFFKEMEVYRTWIQELTRLQIEVLFLKKGEIIKLPYAKFVHGEAIDFDSVEGEERKKDSLHCLDNFIIMEDVRATYGFKMTNRRDSLDINHMRLVFSALAKVHALSWAYRHHIESNIRKRFPFLVSSMDESDGQLWTDSMCSNIDLYKAMYDEEFGHGNALSSAAESYKTHASKVSDILLGTEEAGIGMEKHFHLPVDPKRFGKDAENPAPWRIISHGDCWSNNMLFRYDKDTGKPVEIILVDLQVSKESCVVNDLQYVTYACTDGELRKNYLDELLQLYHDTFNAVCSLTRTPILLGFNIDSLKFRFHRAKFFGYFMANLCLPVILKGEDELADFEKQGGDKDLGQMFAELMANARCNEILKERMIDITNDLITDGVI